MATKFLEPGGDADFLVGTTNGFWNVLGAAPAVATDFVHGNHQKSIKYRPSNLDSVLSSPPPAITGARFSFYIYLVALPTTAKAVISDLRTDTPSNNINLYLTTGGVLQLWNQGVAQIGTDGKTLSTGVWYRISLAFTITSTTVNRFELFVDAVSSISITNATIASTNIGNGWRIGNISNNAGLDFRSSDHYLDDSSSLTDTGDIWVTAKRPNANGTTNGFTTQIGAGGSGYGTGHSPQVNERALSKTNGWSMIGAGSAITEEYNIEGASVGDIDISAATIVDYLGWVSADTLNAETASIIVNNVTSNISLTTTTTLFKKIAGSSTYPAGTGTDIGIITTTALTTVSLYECGIVVAYTPASGGYVYNVFTNNKQQGFLESLGVGT